MPKLHKKQTMWQPHSQTWKLVLGLLPPNIWQFLAFGNNLQLTLQYLRQENLFWYQIFRSNTVFLCLSNKCAH